MHHESVIPGFQGHRTLAAIVFTDGVNFSARMSANEERTLELMRHDMQLMSQLCEQHGGRVLKSTGDGLLMFFSSAVSAVACALEIQQKIAEVTHNLSPAETLVHRIGIHLGDVFISETDVMGNGVNIAARLQTEAEPGGVCISQTVYDVVKPSLSLNAQYLGPLELKNIPEPVPAFKLLIASPNQSDQKNSQTAEHATEGLPTQAITFFNPRRKPHEVVAANLSQEKHLPRIKKLLFCACRNYWESNLTYLNQVPLEELVQEAVLKNPSLDALQQNLNRVVSGLSKPETYALVANGIIREFRLLYSQPNPEEPVTTIYTTVAQAILHDPNVNRIKKLLLCLCRDHWETDNQRLAQVNLPELLQEMHGLVPNLEGLRRSLDGVVGTLNKRAQYAAIADKLLQQVRSLYETEQRLDGAAPETVDLGLPVSPSPLGLANFLPNSPVSPFGGSADATQVMMEYDQPTSEATAMVSSGDGCVQALEESATASDQFPLLPIEHLDLIDVRQDIIAYTVPMRAKILLFSVLHDKFNFTSHDWAILRTYSLDDLLRQMFHRFDNSNDLEMNLEIIARCLNEPDEYVQAGEAITQASAAIYAGRRQPVAAGQVASSTCSQIPESTQLEASSTAYGGE